MFSCVLNRAKINNAKLAGLKAIQILKAKLKFKNSILFYYIFLQYMYFQNFKVIIV